MKLNPLMPVETALLRAWARAQTKEKAKEVWQLYKTIGTAL